jgi:uncharacterized protein DUF6896
MSFVTWFRLFRSFTRAVCVIGLERVGPYIPEKSEIDGVLAVVESHDDLPESAMEGQLSSPSLKCGLDHWQLWTLICLCRHINRQKWVGYVVETRLKGELHKLGRAGAMGHPEDIPQLGKVPDEPGWHYFFHGCGCCLTNKEDGTSIDVDFTDEGASDRIDRFFYSNFLEGLKRPEFPERLLQRKEPFQHAWQSDITPLAESGCLNVERGIHITPLGKALFDSLEPLLEGLFELAEVDTEPAQRKLLYGCVSLGDVLLAGQLAAKAKISNSLAAKIDRAAGQTKRDRAARLTEVLQSKSMNDSSHLAALADLGLPYAKAEVSRNLIRNPFDGVANTSLAIIVAWNQPEIVKVLEDLVEHRYSEAFGFRAVATSLLGGRSSQDQQPRDYRLVHAIRALLERSPSESLNPGLRLKILALLEKSGGANSGEAALLVYALDKEQGLKQLRASLSGRIPASQTDAAAACVLLGTLEAQELLVEALENSDLRIQHTAACALERFPTAEAREYAAHWSARQDGIDAPEGKEVSIAGRTITVYSMDEVTHSNIRAYP